MNSLLESISRIQDVFEGWRQLGTKTLHDGTELIGRQFEGDDEGWMHAMFPRLSAHELAVLEQLLATRLPATLRRFYSSCGGMTLFGGVFRIHGLRQPRGVLLEQGTRVDDIVQLNHELDQAGWKPEGAVAFGCSEWDATVYVAGMGDNDDEIVRATRATGDVLERIADIWTLVADKLYRLDDLFVR